MARPDPLDREVQLWPVPLDACVPLAAERAGVLCQAEQERATRLRREADRRRWRTGRVLTRLILSQYTGEAPERLRFRVGPWGKPGLDAPPGERPLEFNLSHSEALAVLAVSRAAPVGVDIEFVRPLPDWSRLAQRHFSPAERRQLDRLRPAESLRAFFTCWTCKEAVVKALGLGLSFPLDRLDVAFAPGERPRVLAFREDPGETSAWTLHALDLPAGYVGCLAFPSAEVAVRWMALADL